MIVQNIIGFLHEWNRRVKHYLTEYLNIIKLIYLTVFRRCVWIRWTTRDWLSRNVRTHPRTSAVAQQKRGLKRSSAKIPPALNIPSRSPSWYLVGAKNAKRDKLWPCFVKKNNLKIKSFSDEMVQNNKKLPNRTFLHSIWDELHCLLSSSTLNKNVKKSSE